MFEVMDKRGLKPDLILYTSVIDAAKKGYQPNVALKAFQKMWEQRIVPDAIAYNASPLFSA